MELASGGVFGQSSEDSDNPEMSALGIANEEIDVEETTETESESCQKFQDQNSEKKQSNNSASNKVEKELKSGSTSLEQKLPDSTDQQKVDSVKEAPAKILEEKVECLTPNEGQVSNVEPSRSRGEESRSDKPEVTPTSEKSASSTEVPKTCNLSTNAPTAIPETSVATSTATQSKPPEPAQQRAFQNEARNSNFLPKLKSFEDAFKASLEKLKNVATRAPPRKIVRAKSLDSDTLTSSSATKRPLDKEVIDSEKEKKAVRKASSDHKPSSDVVLEKKQNEPESSTKQLKTDVDLSDNEASDSRDIETFSSDSSSTIIELDTETRESTEEKAPVKSPISESSSHSDAKSRQSEKSEETKIAEEAKSKSDPTPATKIKEKVADDSKISPKENTNVRNVTEEKKTSSNSQLKQEKASESTGHDKREQENIGSTSKDMHLEKQRQPSRTFEAPRKWISKDGKAKIRERSKSDESQIALAKKPRFNRSGIMLQPGTKLEAMDYSKKWYAAKIVNVDGRDKTLLIHFDGWNSRFDEWMKFESDRLRPLARVSARRETAKEVKALGGYRVADEVLARWSDCRYYPAKILGIKSNGSYRVLFYDGIEKVVMGINVRDMPDTLKAQHFFSNLEHQFRALVNKKQKGSKDDDGKNKGSRFSKGSASNSRAASPVQQPQKRCHSSTGQPAAPQPLPKRSRQDSGPTRKITTQKGRRSGDVLEPVHLSPTSTEDQTESLVSPTSSEASELMYALEHGMQDGKKRYREPLIFDKNTGLIRDRQRSVAPKELVIDLDHNKYKCDAPDCGKAFRKASLLEYHKKYYHINKPSAASTSAMTAAKNALTRSRKRLSTSSIATSSTKICRTEHTDGLSAKVASRPQRASAPSIMTTSYKRPLPPLKLDSPPPKSPDPEAPQSNHFLMVQSGREKPRRLLTTLRTERPAIQPELRLVTRPVTRPVTQPEKRPVTRPVTQPEKRPVTQPEKRPVMRPVMRPLTRPVTQPLTRPVTQPVTQPQALGSMKAPETVATIAERARRISGTVASRDEKPSTIKSDAPSTAPSEKIEAPSVKKYEMAELEIKKEPIDQEPSDIPPTKIQNTDSPEIIRDLPQKDVKSQSEVAEVTRSPKVLKREKRGKPHKKHKRHKARNRDRRSREQSRQDRRLVAERANQRRFLRQKESPGGPEEKSEDVMEWTSKCVSPKTEGNLPHALSTEDIAANQEIIDSSATEEGGPKEMIKCICRSQEEEGFMIQCEACFAWQHGRCVGLTERTVPKQYLCSFCIYPENLRTHTRHRYDQDWFKTGQLPCLKEAHEPLEESRNMTESMLKTHQLMADMLNVTEALDALQHKLEILKSDNHPDLKRWSYHWGMKDETTPLDCSLPSLQLDSSLEETEHQQTAAETSALIDSRNDSSVIAEEVTLASSGNSERQPKLPHPTETVNQSVSDNRKKVTHEGDTPTTCGPSNIDIAGIKSSAESESLNLDVAATAIVEIESPMEVDCEKAPESSRTENLASDTGALVRPKLHHESGETASPAGKLTACNVGDPAISEGANQLGKVPTHGASIGDAKPAMTPLHDGTPLHAGIANTSAKENAVDTGANLSDDDKPLAKYVKKSSMPVATSVEGKSAEEIKASESSQPNSTLSAAATETTDPVRVTSPSSGGQVSACICKLHLFNHIVCVEDELKRRMDYVEEQFEALELAFAQSTESKGALYIPPDANQVKRTIGVLIEDLERVNKLVSI